MLSRLVIARRFPSIAVMSSRHSSSFNEGSVAQSKEFGKKEKAHEDQYVYKHQEEQLRKLKEQLDAANAEVARLKKESSVKKE